MSQQQEEVDEAGYSKAGPLQEQEEEEQQQQSEEEEEAELINEVETTWFLYHTKEDSLTPMHKLICQLQSLEGSAGLTL